jgi:MYXO-CTERM domain-containing protein
MVNGNGTFSIGANLTTVAAVGWVYTTTSSTGRLDVLAGPGHAGPAHLIIGPPGGPTYANANGSIAGNGPHNPFLNQSATFTITAPNVSADTTITAATFSFGTTEGVLITGVPSTPEPSSLLLGLVGLGVVGSIGLYRRRRGS